MVRQSPVAPMTGHRRPVTPADSGRDARRAAADDKPELSPSDGAAAPRRPPVELGPIIRSKIQPPVVRDTTLTRRRLIDRVGQAVQTRLTLLIAEAGYGKTTLLGDFCARSGIRTLWYRLDQADADIITWANHVIAAVREAEPRFGQATLELMSHLPAGGPPRGAFIASVIGELGRLEPVPTVFVLDDFHAVDESAEAVEFVTRLIRDSPPWLSFVVSARRRPALELGRLSASGEVTEITTDELRFSREETVELFADAYKTPLDDDVVRDLNARTKGWVASLQLFYGSIRGKPQSAVRALARALSGASSPVYDFLAEEVLANLPGELERFLIRSSLLERINAGYVVALFADDTEPPSLDAARGWVEEADRLALLSRSSPSTDLRQLHPLLRDFLVRQLSQRESPAAIAGMHLRLAVAVADTDPLMAAHHYVEGGDEEAAMRCLGASVMLTMGSGQWGVASELIERITGVPADPAVAAIRARRLIEDGDLVSAAELLDGVDVSASAPDVRAVFRHARLSLGWRTGDRDLMFDTLAETQEDPETPPILRDIFQIFVDASTASARPSPLPTLARRLQAMADAQRAVGHTFFAAVSLHNACVAHFNAGLYHAALEAGTAALLGFGELAFFASEQLSTHAIMSLCELELGRRDSAKSHADIALGSGREFADVPAEFAFTAFITGEVTAGTELLVRARVLQQQGQSDVLGNALIESAAAVSEFTSDPANAVRRLEPPLETPLDFGHIVSRATVLAQGLLLSRRPDDARRLIETALRAARQRQARRAEVRLNVLHAICLEDRTAARVAISEAVRSGRLAPLEVAGAVIQSIELFDGIPDELSQSVSEYPRRWLPALRRQLEYGATRAGYLAAAALDEFGTLEDVGLLRAYAKTYARRGPGKGFGKSLARRVSPSLLISDLGKVELHVGERTVQVTAMRRKAASVLMYLVTRPRFSANREQVIDELWREADPASAVNNLNQSLYFLRREIDPWYEDDVSVDYVGFQGDLVWLDNGLVSSGSSRFLSAAEKRATLAPEQTTELLLTYRAPFAPEFEYEEWAMAWRSRLHATFLDLSHEIIEFFVRAGHVAGARQVAAHALRVDPDAIEIERRLIWLYGRMGLVSAARSQHAHLATQDAADGLEPVALADLLQGDLPAAG